MVLLYTTGNYIQYLIVTYMKKNMCVGVCVTSSFMSNALRLPWTVVHLAPLSMRFIRSPGKNTGVGNHSVLQGVFPHPGIKPMSPELQTGTYIYMYIYILN